MKSFFLNRRFCYFSVIACEPLLTIMSQFLYQHPFSGRTLLDSLGTISLIAFNVGLIIFIVQGGFFDSMVYSFKRFSRSMKKNRLGEQEAEAPLAEYKIRNGRRAPITWPLIFVSAAYFLFTLAIAGLI